MTQDSISEVVAVADVADVAEQFGVSQKAIADILGLSIRTLQNRQRSKDNRKLDKNVSERLLRLRELFSVADNYFYSKEAAIRWFKTPNTGLGCKPPLLLCDTFFGMDMVENSIQKLMHGMTA